MKKRMIGIVHIIFSSSMFPITLFPDTLPNAIGGFGEIVFDDESECNFSEFIQDYFCNILGKGYHEAELLYAEPLTENHKISERLQTSILNVLPNHNFALGELTCYDDFVGEWNIRRAFSYVCESENLTCDANLFTDWLKTVRRRWLALVHVAPPLLDPDEEWGDDVLGAFVNIVADVSSKEEFITKIHKELGDFMGFPIREIKDIDLLSSTQEQKITDNELKESMRINLPRFIAFGEFVCYCNEE